MRQDIMSRRGWLGAVTAVAGVSAMGASAIAGAHKPWPLGVQLWTVTAEMQADAPGTLKALKTLGFEVVETAGLYGGTSATLSQQIRDAGLECISCHAPMSDLVADLDGAIANARTLGASWLVCASPVTPGPLDPAQPWFRAMYEAMTLDAWKVNAGHVAAMAPVISKAGLRFAYHNHTMEFRDFGKGLTGYGLLAAASPLLHLEMDIGWVKASGNDPVAMLKKYAGRVDLLHVKDMKADATAPLGMRSVEVGTGIVDWPAVFKTARATGVRGFFVEQEAPFTQPILDFLKDSAAYVAKL